MRVGGDYSRQQFTPVVGISDDRVPRVGRSGQPLAVVEPRAIGGGKVDGSRERLRNDGGEGRRRLAEALLLGEVFFD